MTKKLLSLLVLSVLWQGCSSSRSRDDDSDFQALSSANDLPPRNARKGRLKLRGKAGTRPAPKATANARSLHAYEENEAVQQWIEYFSATNKDTFNNYMRRGSRYRTTIEAILRQHEIPEFLYYLAMIESGFSVTARSHAQAVGVWQFIEGTAKRYDLAVNSYVDERRDPIRATIAAAKYLKDLHNVFQSWFLAMAAYNCGESRVMNAIMNTKTRNYWTLSEMKALPPETRNYLPKIIAAAIIDKNPEAYGFAAHEPEGPLRLKLTQVPAPTTIKDLASAFAISDEILRFYNPQLLGKITPPGSEHYKIWLPADMELPPPTAISSLPRASLETEELPRKKPSLKMPVVVAKNYRVRRGDNLKSIAKRFGMTVPTLKKLNGITGSKLTVGQVLRIAKDSSS